jgi:hypothetical protein
MFIEQAPVSDFEGANGLDASALRFQYPLRPAFRPSRPFRAKVPHSFRLMRVPPATDCPEAHQVVGAKAHQRLPLELGLADQPGLDQAVHGLDPAKGLLDASSAQLTESKL